MSDKITRFCVNTLNCHEPLLDNWEYCPNCGRKQTPLFGAGVQTLGQIGIIGASSCSLNDISRRPGVKMDDHKVKPWEGFIAQFPRAIRALARHTIYGNHQPGHVPGGWKEVPDGFKRYTEALARHCLEEQTDKMMHYEHMVAIGWNAMARIEHYEMDQEKRNLAGPQAMAQQAKL